jgi:hypothetical protein
MCGILVGSLLGVSNDRRRSRGTWVKTETEHIDRVIATLDTDYVIVDNPYMLGARFYVVLTKVSAEFDHDSEGDSGLRSLTLEGHRYRRMADGTARPAPRNHQDPTWWTISSAVGVRMSRDLAKVVRDMSYCR